MHAILLYINAMYDVYIGTGLGLFSLAKRVEAQQGQYGVRSRSDGAAG